MQRRFQSIPHLVFLADHFIFQVITVLTGEQISLHSSLPLFLPMRARA
jgi:hypothetical protein